MGLHSGNRRYNGVSQSTTDTPSQLAMGVRLVDHKEVAMTRTTAEPVLNIFLAEFLQKFGLDAEPEQRLQAKKQHQLDIAVAMPDAAIALEAEIAPAGGVIGDATKRLVGRRPLQYRGRPIHSAFAIVYPARLRNMPPSEAKQALSQATDLKFSQISRQALISDANLFDPEQPDTYVQQHPSTGSAADLASFLQSYWLDTDLGGQAIEDTVRDATHAFEEASRLLNQNEGFGNVVSDTDLATTGALILLNAILFQMLLASNLDFQTIPQSKREELAKRGIELKIPHVDSRNSANLQLKQWNHIRDINWCPIFDAATDYLQQLPQSVATTALNILTEAARNIAERAVVRRHDIAGRIFHRLLNSRKFLATNYTTIPAAVLLAQLALDKRHFPETNWKNASSVGKLRIVDPASGTGTLLMAALQACLEHVRNLGGNVQTSVRQLVTNVMHGYDVVPAAVHMTAANLAMSETSQFLTNMNMYWMPHDQDPDGECRLGSLDFFTHDSGRRTPKHNSLFSGVGDAGRHTGEGQYRTDAYMPKDADLIIANPPYTRHGGPGDGSKSISNPIFGSVPSVEAANFMKEELQRRIQDTPASMIAGLGSAFVVLANQHLRKDGHLAIVLPAVILTGSSWSAIRQLLAQEYTIDYIITSHDPRVRGRTSSIPGRRFCSFSESTTISEVLIVATKSPPPPPQRRT